MTMRHDNSGLYQPAPADMQRALLGSDLVMIGDLAFMHGVLPIDLNKNPVPLPESVEAQMLKILGNMETIADHSGMTRQHVVAVTLHITQLQRFGQRVDEAYAGFFAAARLPTRSVVGVDQLPRGAMVSADFILSRA